MVPNSGKVLIIKCIAERRKERSKALGLELVGMFIRDMLELSKSLSVKCQVEDDVSTGQLDE